MKKFTLTINGRSYNLEIDVRNKSERQIEIILDHMALDIMNNR